MAYPLTRNEARMHLETRDDKADTICATHRALWKELQHLPPDARGRAEEHLVTAYIMGKRMAARLMDHYKDARKGY